MNPTLALLALLLPATAAAAPLTLEDAIRAAWSNDALAASAGAADAARLDAAAARARALPTAELRARAVRTGEPMAVFGMRLDQGRIAAADFDPARLNDPDPIAGYALGASVTQVLYAGGRVAAGRRAATAHAEASALDHERRRQETAAAVVEAYLGAQAAAEAVRHADEVVAHARETERFVAARRDDGLALESDASRATAFRAQAEAEAARARQREASARSALALLAGPEAETAELTTPTASPPPTPPPGSTRAARPDLLAAGARAEAALHARAVARGALLPEVFAQASVDTMRSGLRDGETWTTLLLGARWDLGLSDLRAAQAASAREQAARRALRFEERRAAREVEEARRAVEAALARSRAAEEAVAASESAREIREARHRQGLLPLTDLLDAEAGLAGARALLLASRVEARVAGALLALAEGRPVEGVTP